MQTRLYVKQHQLTGMKYFGKTDKANPYKYNGSGKYWLNHISTHGKEYVETLWVSEPFSCKEDVMEFATLFSEQFDIVNSKEWANLTVENGIDGWVYGQKRNPHSDETRKKMSLAKVGKTVSTETKEKMSAAQRGKVFSEEHKLKLRTPRGIQERVTCPHCGKVGGATGMTRWHFDKCKNF